MPQETNRIISDSALIDTRPIEARQRDYRADDFMAAGVEAAFDNPKPTSVPATLYNQWYAGSCVLHGFYTQLEYEGVVPPTGMSQLRAYRKRVNYPQPGTGADDGYKKIKEGQSPNAEFPTPTGCTEAMATAMQLVVGDKIIGGFKYYGFTDYSLVPAAVSAGKAVAIFIYATEDEWSQEYVTVRTPNLSIVDAYVRHCVCIIPKGDFTENGQKWLAVQDSAKFGGRHLRYVSLDFFLKRCYYASQVFKDDSVPPIPPFKYTFTKQLKYQSARNDANEVRNLQKALQFLKRSDGQTYMAVGVFGPFGPKTKTALGLFQTDHGITDADGQGTNFGPMSRAALNAELNK